MEFRTLNVEHHEHITHVRLNRPEVMNVLNQDMVNELHTCFQDLSRDRDVRVIVLSGEGRAFCAGGDVTFLNVINSKTHTEIREFLSELFEKLAILAIVEKPVISALHGFVMGAGFSLALLSDIRIAAEGTIFGTEFSMMGIVPEAGCGHLLPKIVGLGKAMELVLTGRRFEAKEAERLGLVNKVVSEESLLDSALNMASGMARLPPLALGLSKGVIQRGAISTLRETIQREATLNSLCYTTADHKEATSAFLEKRKPVFKGS